MYAIIESCGKQYKVSEGDVVYFEKLDTEEGKKVTFDNVVLVSDDKNVKVGTPYVKGIKVEATETDAKIDVNIIVEYGSRIPDVAFEIQNRVKKAVESMTGLKVVDVNVHVQGVNTDSNNMNEVKTEDSDKTE